MLYALNLYSDIHQIFSIKTEKNKSYCICLLHTKLQRKVELTFLNRLLIARHGQTLVHIISSIFTMALPFLKTKSRESKKYKPKSLKNKR